MVLGVAEEVSDSTPSSLFLFVLPINGDIRAPTEIQDRQSRADPPG